MKFLLPKISFLVSLFLLITASVIPLNLNAQAVLTLEEAVKIALENNFEIRISKLQTSIAENNVSLANAGLLPRANATYSDVRGIQNTRQIQSDGSIRERTGAKNASLNYGAGLTWTIFDGFGMFARYEQFKQLNKLREQNLQQAVLTQVSQVVNTYYQIVLQQQQVAALDTAVLISRQRRETAQARFEIGKAARLEVLNAQVDYNTDTAALLSERQMLANSKVTLNALLARDPNMAFTVVPQYQLNNTLQLAELEKQALTQNPSLLSAQLNKRIAELDLKQVKANRYPQLSLSSGYNFLQSQTALGFALQTNAQGLTYGISASVNLFNGFLQRQQEQNSKMLVEQAAISIERTKAQLQAQLLNAFTTYKTNLSLVKLEAQNQQTVRKNLDITLEKYRLGRITNVEFRDAQLNYINATVRYNQALYQARLAQQTLQELSGKVVLN